MKPSERDWESRLTELPLGSGGFSVRTIRKVKERIALEEKRKRRRKLPLAIASLLAVSLAAVVFRSQIEGALASWLGPGPEPVPVISETETTTFNIGYMYGSDDFMEKYGKPFIIRHPAVRFAFAEEAPLTVDIVAYKEWLERERPDLIQIPLAYLDDLSAAGLLAELDPLLLRDGIDEQGYHRPVSQVLREAGAGKLYGLADTFATTGLFYNRELFAARGIPEPSGSLTWDETLALAAQFAGMEKDGQPVYGLSFGYRPGLSSNVMSIALSLGMGMTTADGSRSSLGSNAWESLWTPFVQGYRDGWIANEAGMERGKNYAMTELYKLDPFLTGRSAMTFQSNDYLRNIEESREAIGFDADWGILPAPALDEAARAQGQAMEIPYVLAISAGSSQTDAAWELLKYIMSPEQAERRSRTAEHALYTVGQQSTDAGARETFFYEAAIDPSLSLVLHEQQTSPAYQALYALAAEEGRARTDELLSGALTVERFLEELDRQAEQALRELAAQEEELR